MNLDMHGRTALVTGSTAGIGLACANGLAAHGARVIVNGRTAERTEAAVAAIRARGGTAESAPYDLGTAAGVASLVAAFPSVDILVNNVGIFEPVPFAEIDDAAWFRFFETNVMSGVRLSRAYLPGMRERDRGRIVFVSSESGVQIPVEMIHYGVTKTAQIALARGLAEECAGTRITVNSVLPGPTDSEGVGLFVERMAAARGIDRAQMEREFFAQARPSSLIKRFATTDEVASMVVYVCSDAASAVTGAALRVDGGVVRSIV